MYILTTKDCYSMYRYVHVLLSNADRAGQKLDNKCTKLVSAVRLGLYMNKGFARSFLRWKGPGAGGSYP